MYDIIIRRRAYTRCPYCKKVVRDVGDCEHLVATVTPVGDFVKGNLREFKFIKIRKDIRL